MLSFKNSKLTKMTGKGKQEHIFQKSKCYEISTTVTNNGEGQKFIIHVYYWYIPLDHEIYAKCKKKTCNMIIGICSHKICSGIKNQPVKKPFVIQYQKLDFTQNYSVPFHQVTFNHSISCVLLIDKPNENCQNSKKK